MTKFHLIKQMTRKNMFQEALNDSKSDELSAKQWIEKHWRAIKIALDGYAASSEAEKDDLRC
jgi:hypothetical protein